MSWVTRSNKRPSMSPREIVIRCINTNNIGPGIVVFFCKGRSLMAREEMEERTNRYWEAHWTLVERAS